MSIIIVNWDLSVVFPSAVQQYLSEIDSAANLPSSVDTLINKFLETHTDNRHHTYNWSVFLTAGIFMKILE